MAKIITNFTATFCYVEVYDIIVFPKSFEEHKEQLSKVVEAKSNANMKILFEKCKFYNEEVEFLSH